MSTPHVVILGGGLDGLEAALYLRSKLPEVADISLVADEDELVYKANTFYVPFDRDFERLKETIVAGLKVLLSEVEY